MTDINVKTTARLAKLNLTAAEHEKMPADMQRILAYVQKLDELDLEGVAKTLHPVELPSAMRADIATEPTEEQRDALLALAPETMGHCIAVPKVIE